MADEVRDLDGRLQSFVDALPDEKRRMLEVDSGLLSETAASRLEELAPIQADEHVRQVLRAHAALIRECVARGVGSVFDALERAAEAGSSGGGERELFDLLFRAIGARSWGETREMLRSHDALLSDAALSMLDGLVEMARGRGDEDGLKAFEEHRDLFRRCREVGIDEAFADKLGPGGGGSSATEELGGLLGRIDELQGDPSRAGELIGLCEQALGAVGRASHAALWAALQGTRATALQSLGDLSGDRGKLQQAVAGYDLALEVMTREAMPADWATTQMNRANALQRLGALSGDPSVLARAVAGYDLALEVMTREAMPAQWAGTHNNRAAALQSLGDLSGDPGKLQQAVAGYDLALEVRTREAMPAQWASTHNNRAAALQSLGDLSGDPSVYARAVAGYDLALEVMTREAMPAQWATTHNNRANALQRLGALSGDPGKLQQAVAGYDLALEVRTREAMPADWATTHNNRANALQRLGALSGDPGKLQQAVAGYDLALEVMTREAMPAQWAGTHNNRANTLSMLGDLSGDPSVLARAVAGYDLALEVRTREAMPAQWASTHNNRAAALQSLGDLSGDPSVYARAVAGYDLALEVRTREAMPAQWATTHNNRANALQSLGALSGDRGKLQQAVAGYDLALEVRTREAMPADWATTHNNRAAALQRLGDLSGDPSVLARAVAGYRLCLEQRRPEDAPDLYMTTAGALARLLFRLGRWRDLGTLLDEALSVSRDLVAGVALSGSGREQAISRASGLHGLRAWCGQELGETPDRLLEWLEGGRARLLAQSLAVGEERLEEIDGAARVELGRVDDRIAGLRAKLGFGGGGDMRGLAPVERRPAIQDELRAELDGRRKLLDRLGLLPTVRDPVARELLGLVPEGGAVVLPLITPSGSKILVLPHGRARVEAADVIELADLDQERVDAWIQGPREDRELGGYLAAYVAAWRERDEKGRSAADKQVAFGVALSTILEQVWRGLLEPVHRRLLALGLEKGAAVVVLPPGRLSLLPLAWAGHPVARPDDNGSDEAWWSWGDHWTISLAPSLETLGASRARHRAWKAAGSPLRALGVLDPYDSGGPPLAGARSEGEILERHFRDPILLPEREATDEKVRNAMGRTNLHHLSTHGVHDFHHPERSGVMLAHQRRLTLDALLSSAVSIEHLRLVVLSACESGLSGIRKAPDELIGLPAGFLHAGATCVLASHWPVRDDATLLLISAFYDAWLENGVEIRSPAEALREAQAWLRRVTFAELGRRHPIVTHPLTGQNFLDLAADPSSSGFRDQTRAPSGPITSLADPPDTQGPTTNPSPQSMPAEHIIGLPLGPDEERPYKNPTHWAAFSITGV